MKNLKPIFIENSIVPKILSYLAPIKINAITIAFLVFSRGKMSEKTRTHETIHFQQGLELGFIGLWLIYLYDYCVAKIKYKVGAFAYRRIRAEQEAYAGTKIPGYLNKRIRYRWLSKFKI